MVWCLWAVGIVLCVLKACGALAISWWLAAAPIGTALLIELMSWIFALSLAFLVCVTGRDIAKPKRLF
jgi:membrane protein implicated in regulation of membrane protease activity